MYAFDAAVNDARVITVPRKVNFGLDVPGIKEAVLQKKPKVDVRLSSAQALPGVSALAWPDIVTEHFSAANANLSLLVDCFPHLAQQPRRGHADRRGADGDPGPSRPRGAGRGLH
jgi:hypothetical protein